MRAEVLKIRHNVFVESSYLQGGSRGYVLFRHVLPNAYPSVLALAVLQLGNAIIVIAALAFLGYGSPPPASDWGLLVSDGQSYQIAPWLVYTPGDRHCHHGALNQQDQQMATENELTTPGADRTAEEPALLSVTGLTVAYGDQTVVQGVDFALRRGQSLALIGESGSGKSTIARTVLRLLPPQARLLGGQVQFNGRDVLTLGERQFRPLRGREFGFVPQDPGSALNAVRTIGSQAQESAALVPDLDPRARRNRILETFEQVGLADPERVYGSYPHQLSGGMLSRVLIGLAVLPRPALIVADEPTSGLDVTIQKRILDLFGDLQESLGIGLLFITHDLAIAAERADTLVVLKDGVVQERGAAAEVFAAPRIAVHARAARRRARGQPGPLPDRP